ncbi:MAG: hypothetical protein KAS32_18745 [Candidatus Peribacteraceae bacterium]|nr:hypothetical protein [Candidatus Peribacteraceae bacterium]
MTHKELVKKAAHWAKGRHGIVLEERYGLTENPDVLGFSYAYSTLIEVKVTRADFLRDKRKFARRDGKWCMGNYRVYCIPKGLLTEDDIPERWGLLEVYPSGYIRLRVNIYKGWRGVDWWHTLSADALLSERRMLYNHFFAIPESTGEIY